MSRQLVGERSRRAGRCLLAGVLLAFHAGHGDAVSRALDQAKGLALRPVPVVPQRELPQSDMVWVPDRYVRIPGEPGEARVPAHWERRISDREFHVPPLTIWNPSTGTHSAVPHGIKGPAAERHGP